MDSSVVAATHPLVEAFAEVARRYPERPATVHNGQIQTYAELHQAMWTVARRLGPGPGVVGVVARRVPATVASLLGVWAAGGAYCPIDPAFPALRAQEMLAAAGCGQLWEPATLSSVLSRDSVADSGAAPAYVLFTSGSTGAPKPVVTGVRAISTVVGSLRELFGSTAEDRVLQFASLNWDTCFEEILPCLTSGGALIFDDDAHTGSFPRLLRLLERERVTIVDFPTAYWHELVRYLVEGQVALPSALRLVIIGGEAVSPARLADWSTLDTDGTVLLNTYGCTETTLITHAARLTAPADPVPIGHPLPHVVQRISSEGELHIGGPALADGYRELPSATEDRFITDAEGRFFSTRDRVCELLDGTLVHLGRMDDEVKIRGVRVSPTEVEAHISACPGVLAVAVVAVTVGDHVGLTAFVEAAGDTDVKSFLRERVPRHLIPSRIALVPALPRTATGKIDRASLRSLP